MDNIIPWTIIALMFVPGIWAVIKSNKKASPMSTREKFARILSLPFFLVGICWFWVHRAITKGYQWEKEQFPHLQ